MAIKLCKECGKPVSTQAQACPTCGAVLKKKTSPAVGCLAVLLCFGGISALVQTFSESTSSSNPSSSSSTESQSSQAAEPVQPKAKLEVLDAKWVRGDFNVMSIKGTVRNNTKKQYGYVQVEINLYDGSGAQVGSTLANVNNLEPLGIWHFEAVVAEESARRFKVKDVTGF